ncbi:30S ribosomal protein S20 [Candidatus Nomurabacteria bacterium]|nr:30S ribosomal protein S20 [Candidatus Nomurabacteria bacterium]
MPIIKSAVKRMHQTVKRKARNQVTKRNLRDETKAFAVAIAAKDAKKAGEELKKVQSALDIAVKKNILKKNTAARKMSRLSAQAKAAGVKPLASAKKAAPKTAKPAAKAPTKKAPAKATTKKPAAKK